MNPFTRITIRLRGLLTTLLAIILLSPSVAAWTQSAVTTPAITRKAAVALTATERKAADSVKLATIREVTTKLSSNEFEGRGTGQPGADKAANYLATQFARLGLKPGGDNGTYLQTIKFRSAEVLPESSVKIGDVALRHRDDYVLVPPYASDQVDATGGVVFAGYGVVSTDLKRNDLEGLEVKGKIVIILGGQPAGVDDAAWKRATAPLNRAMGIFGRGALAMVVANAGTAAQPYSTISNYLSRRRVSLASASEAQFKIPPVLLASNEAMEKIFKVGSATFAQVLDKAKSGEMVSRDLGVTSTIALRIKREESTSSNVVGVQEGSDGKLKEEAVVYTAHYDAYGIDRSGLIYPGAADNALGTATITGIAEAFAKAFSKPSDRPRR